MASERHRRMGDTLQGLDPIHGETDSHEMTHTFQLRVGPNYKKHKRKEPCTDTFYDLVACDIFTAEKKIRNITQYVQLPSLPAGLGKVNDVPPYFVVNVMFPMYKPPMFSKQTDGNTFHFVAYFLMKPETQIMLHEDNIDEEDPAVRLLRNFFLRDDLKDRFKVIAGLMNPSEAGMSRGMAALVRSYNFKPLLTRPQHVWSTDDDTYIECAIDVHDFNYLCRSTWHAVRGTLPKMVMEVAFTVEGRSDDELPEALLARDIFHNADYDRAVPLDPATAPVVPQHPDDFHIHEVVPHLYGPPGEEAFGLRSVPPCQEVRLGVTAEEDVLAMAERADARELSVESSDPPSDTEHVRVGVDTPKDSTAVFRFQHQQQQQRHKASPPENVRFVTDVDITTRKARKQRRLSRTTSVSTTPERGSASSMQQVERTASRRPTSTSSGGTTPSGRVKIKVEDTIHLPITDAMHVQELLETRASGTSSQTAGLEDTAGHTETVVAYHDGDLDEVASSDDEFFDCLSEPAVQ